MQNVYQFTLEHQTFASYSRSNTV